MCGRVCGCVCVCVIPSLSFFFCSCCLETILVSYLDIISNLILGTLKGRVRGKGEGVRKCGRRRAWKRRGEGWWGIGQWSVSYINKQVIIMKD